MNPQDALRHASRFFARPESFTLECPKCGKVYRFRVGVKDGSWDPSTGQFRCVGKKGCQKVYIIGLVAWPITARARPAGVPRDQVPNERQLAQMRAEGGGWWLPDAAAQRFSTVHTTNITTEEDRPLVDPDEEEPNE